MTIAVAVLEVVHLALGHRGDEVGDALESALMIMSRYKSVANTDRTRQPSQTAFAVVRCQSPVLRSVMPRAARPP